MWIECSGEKRLVAGSMSELKQGHCWFPFPRLPPPHPELGRWLLVSCHQGSVLPSTWPPAAALPQGTWHWQWRPIQRKKIEYSKGTHLQHAQTTNDTCISSKQDKALNSLGYELSRLEWAQVLGLLWEQAWPEPREQTCKRVTIVRERRNANRRMAHTYVAALRMDLIFSCPRFPPKVARAFSLSCIAQIIHATEYHVFLDNLIQVLATTLSP